MKPAAALPAALLALAAALTGPGSARAENWYPFYMVPSGVAYVDKDSVIFRPGHVTAKVQSTFPEPQRLQRNGRIYSFIKSKDTIDVDCEARVYRYVARDLYNNAGVEQLSVNEADSPFMIRDRTPEAVLADAYCPRAR